MALLGLARSSSSTGEGRWRQASNNDGAPLRQLQSQQLLASCFSRRQEAAGGGLPVCAIQPGAAEGRHRVGARERLGWQPLPYKGGPCRHQFKTQSLPICTGRLNKLYSVTSVSASALCLNADAPVFPIPGGRGEEGRAAALDVGALRRRAGRVAVDPARLGSLSLSGQSCIEMD